MEILRLKKMLDGELPPDVNVVEKRVKVKRPSNIQSKLEKERQKFEKEKQRILGDETIQEKKDLEEKQKMIAEQHKEEKEKQQELAKKLKEIKQQMLHGDKLKE